MENQQNSIDAKKLLPIGQLFSQSFELYKSKFTILTKIAALNFLVFLVLIPFGGFFAGVAVFYNKNLLMMLVGLLALLVGILLVTILGLWVSATLFFAVKDANNDTKLTEVLKKSWPAVGSLFWVVLLTGLVNLAGFLLFIIPGIIFVVWFMFSCYAFVFDGVKGTEALKKSKALVKGYWWPLLGRLALIVLISFAISSMKFFGSIISTLFFSPFTIVFFSVIYQDLKKHANN